MTNSKKSVALLLHSPSRGGAQIAFIRLAKALAAAGYRVAIVCQVGTLHEVAERSPLIEYHFLNAPRVRHAILPLMKFCKEWKADIVISALLHTNLCAILTKMLSLGSFRVVVTEHAPLKNLIASNRWNYSLLSRAIRFFYRRADAVIAVSQGVLDEVLHIAPGVRLSRVVYNPIIDNEVVKLSELPITLPWPGEDPTPVILAAGRLAPEKDFPFLVRAFARVRRERPVRLVILGEGSERATIERLIAELGCSGDVYMPGWADAPFAYLKRATVVAMTSQFEGFGNVLAEALACGTPVVATDCPFGPREILQNGKFGKLVAPGDEEAFATALIETLDSDPDRSRLMERADDFSTAAALQGYQEVIEQVAPEREAVTPPASLRVSIYMHDLSGGGAERMTLKLIEHLRGRGVDVTLLLHSGAGPLSDLLPPDLRVVRFQTARTLFDLVPLWRHLMRERPDILISGLDHNTVIALFAGFLAGRRTPVVPIQHNALSREAASGGWKYAVLPACYRLFSPAASRFVAVSRGVADDMASACGIARDRISVIYNSVIDEEFKTLAAEPIAHPWFDRHDVPVFVNAGRLVPQKDHESLLRAFAQALQRRPMRLMILGVGPLQEHLLKVTAELRIEHAVQFLGFQRNPLPYFREADALVLTSQYEGFGNVLIEAMGCGTPVITVDCPYGPSEIIEGGKFGVLVPIGNTDALADALASDEWRKCAPTALKRRAEIFNMTAMADQYLALIESCVCPPRIVATAA
jgi:glycosyltransferase involved in cell wall biosynthesis